MHTDDIHYDEDGDNTTTTRDTDTPAPRFINAYSVTRHYGGPEEGGWYYNRGEPLASIPVDTDEEADAARAKLEARYSGEARGNIYSVRGGVELDVLEEEHFATAYPTRRPHYE